MTHVGNLAEEVEEEQRDHAQPHGCVDEEIQLGVHILGRQEDGDQGAHAKENLRHFDAAEEMLELDELGDVDIQAIMPADGEKRQQHDHEDLALLDNGEGGVVLGARLARDAWPHYEACGGNGQGEATEAAELCREAKLVADEGEQRQPHAHAQGGACHDDGDRAALIRLVNSGHAIYRDHGPQDAGADAADNAQRHGQHVAGGKRHEDVGQAKPNEQDKQKRLAIEGDREADHGNGEDCRGQRVATHQKTRLLKINVQSFGQLRENTGGHKLREDRHKGDRRHEQQDRPREFLCFLLHVISK